MAEEKYTGWFSLERGLWDHWLAPEKPYSKFEAWVDLIKSANHAPAKVMLKGQLFDIERGQQARSMVTLSNNWGWSRAKVKRFLNLLIKEGKIVQQTNPVTSIISICNYSEKQNNKAADVSSNSTAEKHQTNIKQNINNNVNNENNDISDSKPFNSDDLKCANYLLNAMKAVDPKFKVNNIEDWADEVRLIREVDLRNHKEICSVFKFARQSDHYKKFVNTPSALRKYFSAISVQAKQAKESKPKIMLPNTDFSFLEWVIANSAKYKFPSFEDGGDLKAFRALIQNQVDEINEG